MADDDTARNRLDTRLHVDAPVFTLSDVSSKTGIPRNVVRRIWRALGLAMPSGNEPAFTAQDVELLEHMHRGVRAEVIDVDTEVRLARAVGQTLARLADWQVSTIASLVDQPDSKPDRGAEPRGAKRAERRQQRRSQQEPPDSQRSRLQASLELLGALGDNYGDVLVAVWRRHLSAGANRLEAIADVGEDPHTVVATVGFADLVSFSALSNELDDDRIGDLVEIFETRAADVVAKNGGRVIKTLGDSVLFVTDDVHSGMEIALGIIDVIGADTRLPDVHLGLATGQVLLRFGDVFGPPVNLAARLTSIARRNRVIIDESTAAQLPEDRYETRPLTARPVRGFGVMEPIAVRRL